MHKHRLLRARLYLILLFLFIALPSVILLVRSYRHLSSEEELARHEAASLITEQLAHKIQEDLDLEDRRSFTEYRYLVISFREGQEELLPSPLAQFPFQSIYRGLIGHFQIEADGRLRSPLVPEGRLSALQLPDRNAREAVKGRLESLLQDRSVFRYGQVQHGTWTDLEQSDPGTGFLSRREQGTEKQGLLFDVENLHQGEDLPANSGLDVEVHPFHAQLRGGYLIYHRNVFRLEKRIIQGFVVDASQYLGDLISKLAKPRFATDEMNISIESSDNHTLATWGNAGERSRLVLELPIQGPIEGLHLSLYASDSSVPKGSESLFVVGLLLIFVSGIGLLAVERMLRLSHETALKQSDFISSVSHELKTPITAIMMNCEMLEQGMVPDEKKRAACYRRINGEAGRLNRLIHNILDLTQLERNRWRIKLERINLEESIRDLVKLFEPSMELNRFDLRTDLQAPRGSYSLDRDAIRQILSNLLENAMKFCIEPEQRIIEIKTRAIPEGTELVIRDFGPGVPPGEIRKIFDSFYRVERELVRKTSGTGIGLSLVRHFCEQMDIGLLARNANPGLAIHLTFRDPQN